MPASKKWEKVSTDLTWNDVAEAENEWSAFYRCRIEWRASWVRYSSSSDKRFLTIYCEAISGRPGMGRLIGTGQCGFRTGRGAASVPGAYLRSMMDACEDLARRREDPRYNRDQPSAPPWEE